MKNNTVNANSNSVVLNQASLTEDQLRVSRNPALNRLVDAIKTRGTEHTANYSRMHHRHNRS